MSLFYICLLNISLIATLLFLLWLVSLPIRNVSIVDIFWGLGFVVIVWSSCLSAERISTRGLLVAVLTSIWGLRLAIHLAYRNWGEPEDHRYQAMRKQIGSRFPFVSLIIVFGLQGLIMWLVAFPIQVANDSDNPLQGWDVLGMIIWAIGLCFEAVGDWQLARFKANPANEGKVLDRGLWRYTRHPNYFGDFLIWWGFYVMALAAGHAWTIFSPILMSILLMRVSGVTLLERSLLETRSGYQEYVTRTSPFFPMPPRNNSA